MFFTKRNVFSRFSLKSCFSERKCYLMKKTFSLKTCLFPEHVFQRENVVFFLTKQNMFFSAKNMSFQETNMFLGQNDQTRFFS